MKRFIKLSFFVMLLIFGIIGCSNGNESVKETTEKPSETVKEEVSKDLVNEEKKETEERKSDPASSVTNEEINLEKPVNNDSQNTTKTSPDNTTKQTAGTTKQKESAATVTPSTTKPATSAPKQGTTPKQETTTPSEPEKPAETITISIKGPKERGTILGATKVAFKDGDTVFDVLLQTTKKQKIAIETRGSGATAYVEGIDNFYEFDYGVKSGWVFELNGVSLTKSIGTSKVKDGDRIECYYTE